MRTDVSRETSRLTGMRAVPRAGQGHYGGQGSGLGTRAPVREEVGEAAPVGGRQSEGGDASRGAGRPATPQGPLQRNPPKAGAKEKTQQRLGLTVMGRQPRGGRPPRSARTGSRRHRPQKAGKQGGRERTLCTIIGACRRRRGGKPQVGRNGEGEESCIARVLCHAQGNDPSQGARRHGSHPAPPPTRTDVSRETFRPTGMRAAPRAGRRRRTERRGRPGQRTRTQIPRNRAQNANPE